MASVKKTAASKKVNLKNSSIPQKDSSINEMQNHIDVPKMIRKMATENEKRASTLVKQLEALRIKAEKAGEKQKEAKDKRVELVQRFRNKPTESVERQLEKAKDNYQTAFDSADAVKQELVAVRNATRAARENSSKLAALAKLVEKFEKQWAKKLAKANKKAKAKADAEAEAEAEAAVEPVKVVAKRVEKAPVKSLKKHGSKKAKAKKSTKKKSSTAKNEAKMNDAMMFEEQHASESAFAE